MLELVIQLNEREILLEQYNRNYIPLILENSDSCIRIYILNNQLVVSETYGDMSCYPYRSFKLLIALYNNEHTRVSIPQQLHQYLEKEIDYLLQTNNNYPLMGYEKEHEINLNMKIDESLAKPVLLYNLEYVQGAKTKKYSFTISLTAEEAFLIFANILANSLCFNFDYMLKNNWLRDFEQLDLKDEVMLRDLSMYEFTLEYLKLVKQSILEKKITPYTMQHYSGSRVLAFLGKLQPVKGYFKEIHKKLLCPEKLLTNEKILYCHFLHSFRNYVIHEKDEEIENLYAIYAVYTPLCREILFKNCPSLKAEERFKLLGMRAYENLSE